MIETLEVFFGDANNAEARVYARLDGADLPGGRRLTGRVVGPTCEYSHTLSATVPFVMKRPPHGAGDAPLLAEAVVPDPCCWSQELPFLYRAEVELRSANELLAATERSFGIRPVGARGQRLVWEGRPWVLRAADSRGLPQRPMSDWRAADLAMLVDRPDEKTCREASRFGAVLVADLTTATGRLTDELRRLARWPAVAVAVVGPGHPPEALHSAARNLLVAERFAAGGDRSASSWADLVICEESSADTIALRAAGVALPVLAQRPAGWCDDLDVARRHCDRLQRELAGRGEFSGYIV